MLLLQVGGVLLVLLQLVAGAMVLPGLVAEGVVLPLFLDSRGVGLVLLSVRLLPGGKHDGGGSLHLGSHHLG